MLGFRHGGQSTADNRGMINPYKVGDTVLAARAEDGQNHEEAQVIDAYSLPLAS